MPAHETYLLHVYRSRAVSGWQWAARLEHLPSGKSWRFTDPEALLAHLRAIAGLVAPAVTPTVTLPEASPPTTSRMEGEVESESGPSDQGGVKSQ